MAEKPYIPFFEVEISKSALSPTGVSCVSLVTSPAIEHNFITLSSQDRASTVRAVNTGAANQAKLASVPTTGKKGYVTGPLLIPDFDIFRLTEGGQPYFIRFTKDGIEQIRDKFFQGHHHRTSNEQHNAPLAGNTIVESQIVTELNKAGWDATMGYDVPVGTWMATMKIEDLQYFESEVLSGNLLGFSIEGYFDYVEITDAMVSNAKLGNQAPVGVNSNIETQMSSTTPKKKTGPLAMMKAAFLSVFKSMEQLATYTLEDGTTEVLVVDETQQAYYLTDAMEQGEAVADGDYKLADGTTLVIVGGKLSEIKPAEVTATEDASTTPATAEAVEGMEAMAKTLGIDLAKLQSAALSSKVAMRNMSEKFTARRTKTQLAKVSEKAMLSILVDPATSKPMYLDQNSGQICYIEDNGGYLWTGDYVPAGSYTLADASVLVVVEKEDVYDEGTDWEFRWTTSYVDYEASTVAPEVLIPWFKKATSELATLSANTLNAVNTELSTAKSSIVALTAQVAQLTTENNALKAAPAAKPMHVPLSSESGGKEQSKAMNALSAAHAHLSKSKGK